MSDISIPEMSSGDLPEGVSADSGTMITPDQIPAPAAAPSTSGEQIVSADHGVAESVSTLSEEAQNYSNEKAAFIAGAEAVGTDLPGNFESFDAYFDALKESQGQYTRARQEIAELKAAAGDDAVEAEATPEADAPEVDPNDELLIKEPEVEAEAEAEAEEEYEVVEVGVDEDVWNAWGHELDTTGEFSEETYEAVAKSFPGVTNEMIDMYISGRKSMVQDNFNTAAEAVGGGENLNSILEWAGQNLPADERAATNAALQTPARNATLLGLKARYDSATLASARSAEPNATPNRVNAAMSEQPLQSFANTQEMVNAQRDARYGSDAAYTAEIQQRMAMSKWLYGG